MTFFKQLRMHWFSLCLLALGLFFVAYIYHYLTSPLFPKATQQAAQPVILNLDLGMDAKGLGVDLKQLGSKKPAVMMDLASRAMRVDTKLKAGEYSLAPNITPIQLLRKIKKGDVVPHLFTIIPGSTWMQVSAKLKSENVCRNYQAQCSKTMVMKMLAISHSSIEGQLFPDTYEYTRYQADAMLKKAYAKKNNILSQEWASGDPAAKRFYGTPYRALIMASLIEEEAKVNAERPMIASVLLNRMSSKHSMPLQVDASTLYGLEVSGKKMLLADANKNLSSPYNTYKHYGLPPTPIDFPGLSSLDAALHPAKTNYLYYVAKGDGSGMHSFSVTFAGHRSEVQMLKRRLS